MCTTCKWLEKKYLVCRQPFHTNDKHRRTEIYTTKSMAIVYYSTCVKCVLRLCYGLNDIGIAINHSPFFPVERKKKYDTQHSLNRTIVSSYALHPDHKLFVVCAFENPFDDDDDRTICASLTLFTNASNRLMYYIHHLN